MAVRLDQVVVIIDDFSYRSLGGDNVYYYDAGYLNSVRLYDYGYNGYGGMDEFEYLYLDELGGFYPISPADFAEPEQSYYTLELVEEGTLYDTSLDPSGNTIHYSDYLEFTGDEPTSDETELHGDWVLDAFLNQLDNQNTDIILIDVDQWSGDVLDTHLQELFLLVDTPYAEGQVTQLQLIVDSWIAEHNSEEQVYSFSTLSYSIAGVLPDLNQSIALDWMESQYTIVVQATPNVGQGEYNWGSLYPSVINVAAWNVDEDGTSLHANPDTDETLDIFADGYVVHEEWGAAFGTSFATPRVAAELTNELGIILEDINRQLLSGELTTEELLATEPLPYADIVDIMLTTISSPVLVDFDNGWVSEPRHVLGDDVANNLFPVTVPRSVGGSGIQNTVVETVYLVTDVIDHGDGSQDRTYLDQDGVEWAVYYVEDQSAYSETLTSTDGATIEKQAIWSEDGSYVATRSSSYRDRIGNLIDKVWQWDSATSTENISRTDASTGQRSVSRYRYDEVGEKTALYADTLISEDLPFSYDASTSLFFQGVGGSGRSYSARLDDGSALPAWLEIDMATGQFTGTPDNDGVGLLEVIVGATDGDGDSADTAFYLTVSNVNDAPTVTGNLVGGVIVGGTPGAVTATGTITGGDLDEYPHFGTAIHWTSAVDTTDVQGRPITTYTNSIGDTMVRRVDGDLSMAHTKTAEINLANGDWYATQVVVDEAGDRMISKTNSHGEDQVDRITYNEDGSWQTSLSGDREYYGTLYSNANGVMTYDAAGVITSIEGQSLTPSGDVATTSMGLDGDGLPVLVITTATEYGMDSVHREGLHYRIENQLGVYGSLELDHEANWSYTLEEDEDTLLLSGDSVVSDTFRMTISDGIDETGREITVFVDSTPVDAVVKVDEAHYLTETGVTYLSAKGENPSPFPVSNGELRLVENMAVDGVRLPEGVYDLDINISDAIDVLRHIVNLERLADGGGNYHAADVNNDDNINISDAIDILRHIVNLESIDSFDLINEQGIRIQQLDVNDNGAPGMLHIVANGDVNQSGTFLEYYIIATEMV